MESELTLVFLVLSLPLLHPLPGPGFWDLEHVKLLWSPSSRPQACVPVDGSAFLGCLHQHKLWMPCERVVKTLKHPSLPGSSPSQPSSTSYWRTGLDAPSACIPPWLHATACFIRRALQVLPARPVPPLPRILGDAGALQMLLEEQSPATLSPRHAVWLAPWPICSMGSTGHAPLQRRSPPTPLEMSCWLRWEQDHILTRGMQVEAAQ